ncbi:MAG: helix-turn-helix domain containing protein [Ruminococcus sp.]|nr:helix-turn-helix domain containing protein [Ruminococcus sp.]MCM1380319.1 helix-turn-helix domain containing protein [Muribaculaceae bacterium]MCM1478231.1 helix-turn-helix domain containing protein [Muribaculaceae bacterium]
MAARVTDKQRKKIIADYIQLESYRAVAKLNDVSDSTVKRIVLECGEITQKIEQKKEENTADILAYMEQQKSGVCEVLGICLDELKNPEKYAKSSPQQIATTMAILIDKFTSDIGKAQGVQDIEDDPLTVSLKELAKELEENAD